MFLKAVFFGLLQGVTEFLPISSSGHLALFQHLFHFKVPLFFDVLAHLGTMAAVIIYFKKDLFDLLNGIIDEIKRRKFASHLKTVVWLVLATLPAGLVGIISQNFIARSFGNLRLLSLAFLLTAIILILPRFGRVKIKNKYLSALIVGLSQALALLPGVSRSGTTITCGYLIGLEKEKIFRLSFFMALIVVVGASILQIPAIIYDGSGGFGLSLVALVFSFISGWFSLGILEKIFLRGKLWYFSFYCFSLSLAISVLA